MESNFQACIAVIGCGRIAKAQHFPAFSALKNVRVKYACDIIEEKAQAMKAQYDFVDTVITDYQTALADREVEAVFVLTPNYTHYTVTMDALKAGKHVFCEKPITVNSKLSFEMAARAKEKNLLLNIGVCNRYNAAVEKLEEMNRQNKFGTLYHIVCSFRSYRNIPGLGGAFTDKKQSGGGVLIDWGVHFLDLIMYILGGAKVLTVSCDTYSEMAKHMPDYRYQFMWAEDTADMVGGVNDVEDFISGYIRTDKASISLNGAWAQNINQEEMYIDFLGDKGGARLSYGGSFRFYSQDESGTLTTVDYNMNIPNSVQCENAAFLEAVKTGEKTKTHIEQVLETARLMDALYDSAHQKREILL